MNTMRSLEASYRTVLQCTPPEMRTLSDFFQHTLLVPCVDWVCLVLELISLSNSEDSDGNSEDSNSSSEDSDGNSENLDSNSKDLDDNCIDFDHITYLYRSLNEMSENYTLEELRYAASTEHNKNYAY
jgi:hypothetical protein